MARRRFRVGILFGCLILALMLWGFVTLTRMYEDDVAIPLVVQPPPNQALLSTVPTELVVHVRATGLQILNLKYLNRSALCSVDLSKLSASAQGVFTVDREHFIRGISTPEPVRILSVFPASVAMATGDLFVKKVPVRLQTNIATRDGFEIVGSATPEPAVVEVRGTRSVVEGIDSWPTRKISLEDLHNQVETIAEMSDSLTTLLNVVPPRIRVHVNVQQKSNVCIANVPVTIESGTGIVVRPQYVSVTLQGGIEELAALTANDIHASVTRTNVGYVQPTIAAIPNVQVLGVSPSWVRITNIASP
ncbi:MAG: YbbR-like domain-containing protein [Bradyrhizobiaceae bacterium]|nr:YbbR-like domain-containing protein [Bradyrhizobiaceae bacterium]